MRKYVLLAIGALVALAVAAPAASANPIEVVQEDTAVHCSPSCAVHVVNDGLIELADHDLGHIADCTNEYDLTVDENGVGGISGFNFGGSGLCPFFTACEQPWEFTGEEVDGVVVGDINVCLNAVVKTCRGEFEVTVDDDATEAAPLASEIGDSGCEVTGHWNTEASTGVDIIH
jgi:hypothetical protein